MSEIKEYGYYEEHLTEEEALEMFKSEKKRHPGSIVTLDGLDCGHWRVKVYESDDEKEGLLRARLGRSIEILRSYFRR